MTVSNVIIDLSDNGTYGNNNDIYSMTNEQPPIIEFSMTSTLEPIYIEGTMPIIEYLPVLPCPTVTIQAPGAPQVQGGSCPGIKYSGNTITLQATPADGIGPYIVTFKKNGVTIGSSRLGGSSNPISNATEGIQITRVYTLDDLDVSSATGGTIDFSVLISDSCPTEAKSCESTCTVNLGCIAPVCNFTVA